MYDSWVQCIWVQLCPSINMGKGAMWIYNKEQHVKLPESRHASCREMHEGTGRSTPMETAE
jgi:hypothetical protein